MKRICRHFYKKEKGFTLVELMIVIIILAVLTGIAIPSYMTLRNRARESATEAEMKNIATALELYMADIEEYPAAADMAALGTALAPYMNPVPPDDAWGKAYVYAQTGSGTGYTLTSGGANGVVDGTYDIVFTNGQMTAPGAY